MTESWSLLRAFFPPDLSAAYLTALLQPLLETLSLALGAMTVACVFSLPLGIAAAMNVRAASALVALLAAFRAIPDLTLAILCVIVFGIGTGAGMVALVLYYTAALAKVFADLLRNAPREPLEALVATGASRLQVALYGRLPLMRDDVLSYGAFAFECALRASVIVGAVGGGGIGAELSWSLAGFDFHRATTVILLLVLIIAIVDRTTASVRRCPRWLIVLLPIGMLAVYHNRPTFFAFDHALRVIGEMAPPHLDSSDIARLPTLVWETLWMALVSTSVAAVCALVFAVAASRKLAPWWVGIPIRRSLELLRTIPEVVWGLVLVAVVGVGPLAGAWALGLHSFGTLARLFADSLDNAAEAPQHAIASTGASKLVVACYATIPLAREAMLTHTLFRLEWNLRMATVLGLIGAGGIGQALYEAQQLFFYRKACAYVLVTAVLILVTDYIGMRMRARLRGANAAPRVACMQLPLSIRSS